MLRDSPTFLHLQQGPVPQLRPLLLERYDRPYKDLKILARCEIFDWMAVKEEKFVFEVPSSL